MLEQTFDTPLPLRLDVSIPSGEIEVETTDGEQTSVTVDGDDRILENVEVRNDGGKVVVSVREKSKFGISLSFGNSGLRVHARVPHGAGVKVKTASADTRLAGSFAGLELNSASGDVQARGEIAEDARIKTVSGDVQLDRVDGNLSVQCVSGDIRVRSVAGSAETKSVSGDIRLDALTAGDVHFTSVSGDIELGIAQGSLLDVDAGSTSGDLSSEVPLASEPVLGESAAAPTVVLRGRTVSGDVKVFRAG